MENNQNTSKQTLTFGSFLEWAIGIPLAFLGLITFFSQIFPAIFLLTMATILLPPARRWVSSKLGIEQHLKYRYVAYFIFFVLLAAVTKNKKPTPHPEPTDSGRTTRTETVSQDDDKKTINNTSTSESETSDTTETGPEESISQKKAIQ